MHRRQFVAGLVGARLPKSAPPTPTTSTTSTSQTAAAITIIKPAERVHIQGIVIGVIRKYHH